MGIVSTKDTRRISLNNTFEIAPAIRVQKNTEKDSIVKIEKIPEETENDLLFKIKEELMEPYELNENDYWAHRIDQLKKEHNSMNKIIELEYQKTLSNNNIIKTYQFPNITLEKTHKVKPHFELRAKVMQCYEENPHQPLMCAPVVQAFSECVKLGRIIEN